MTTPPTLYATILLLGAAHGVFLALLLVRVNSGNQVALRLLALLTLTFAIDLSINYLNVSGYLEVHPRLVFVEWLATFLYGPLIYLYVLALTSPPGWQVAGRQWLHFLPAAGALLLLAPVYGLADDVLVDLIYAETVPTETGSTGLVVARIVTALPRLLIGAYLLLAFGRLIRHGREIREQFSMIEHISLNWLRNLLVAVGILWAMYFVALAFGGKGPIESLLNVAIVVVIYTLGYMGMRQPAIFTQRETALLPADAPETESASSAQPKYRTSALDDESSRLLLKELTTLMADEQPHLDSKLTLAELAARLGISPNYLSQVINQQTGSHFFDYVNSHRVESAKAILVDPDQSHKNVLTIAMDAGFNSKSAFYTAFRHHENMTPSQYRRANSS